MVAPPGSPVSPPPPPRIFDPSTADDEELTVHHGESDATCMCTEVWTVFLIFFYDFGFKDSNNESGWPLMGSC